MENIAKLLSNIVKTRQSKMEGEQVEMDFKRGASALGIHHSSRVVDRLTPITRGVTPKEASKILGCSLMTVYSNINAGKIRLADNAGSGRLLVLLD